MLGEQLKPWEVNNRTLNLDFKKDVVGDFADNDFPKNDEWGMNDEALKTKDLSAGKNFETLNYARALEVAKQSGATPDIYLAIAAAAAATSKTIKSGKIFLLKGVSIQKSEGKVTLMFGEGGEQKIDLSATEIAKYHIPTIAGYGNVGTQEVLKQKSGGKAPEMLWNIASNPKNDDSGLEIRRFYRTGYQIDGIPEPTDSIGIGRVTDGGNNFDRLAQFPIDKLNFSQTEKRAMEIGGRDVVCNLRLAGKKLEDGLSDRNILQLILEDWNTRKPNNKFAKGCLDILYHATSEWASYTDITGIKQDEMDDPLHLWSRLAEYLRVGFQFKVDEYGKNLMIKMK